MVEWWIADVAVHNFSLYVRILLTAMNGCIRPSLADLDGEGVLADGDLVAA
jgi:hypothetical protein